MAVEVAQMNTVFTAITSGFQKGLSTVRTGLNTASDKAKSVNADMARMGSSTLDASVRLGALGTVGVGAFAALAKSSPLMAPSLAKMNVEMFKLSNIAGEVLAPHMETLVSHFSNFVGFVGENKGELIDLADGFATTGEQIASAFLPPLQEVGKWYLENKGVFSGISEGVAAVNQSIEENLLGGGTISESVSQLFTGGGPQRGVVEGGGLGVVGAGIESITSGSLIRNLTNVFGLLLNQQTRKQMMTNASDFVGEVLG